MTGAGYMIALGFGVFAGIALITIGCVLWRRHTTPRTALNAEPTRTEQDIINRMTNWQRNQWARAGYPLQVDALFVFAAASRRGG